MKLTLNGEVYHLDGGTVADLLPLLAIPPDRTGVAIAVNDSVVPRRAWGYTVLSDGDVIEIIRAMQGG